ncbi:MAG: RNA polymerase sigma factor [Candidatus Thiodiazotropha sp. (ex Lucinoma borealis)]|nr:RNA polymerase sigma factor [Candidatus Thiodiazotropha sp. (ex Lucinoma borealis)]MCU7854303.1 RNA polymerase sigma factor [Candidatus Thiodiazotropha sp. (ex Lucinoma borealis)]MCU7866104.1 RNA polymerase sigma factor [Candidatus Thiodiazotropha sp. (ex Lucinoma borealis)]MCU7868568.1 RNA polymerase sigma factor [Candidatus Thiodiazotropha sp. (ex Lucinoma borealis)]
MENIPHLRRYARVLTRDNQQTEDLVQDCLDRAWSRMSQWQADTNLRAWLFTIMHNLHVNTLRRNSRQVEWEYLDGKDLVDTRQTDQEGAMDLRDLEKALNRLSADQREVLILVCVEGLSYAQVSEVLNVPTGTIMSRLHRAREEMRRWLHGDEIPKLRRVK